MWDFDGCCDAGSGLSLGLVDMVTGFAVGGVVYFGLVCY